MITIPPVSADELFTEHRKKDLPTTIEMEEDTKVRSFMPAEVGLEDDSIAMLAEKSKGMK